MKKEKLKIVDAKIIPSTIKECKEVLITYKVNGELEHYYAFVDKNEKNPINAAKKEFETAIKNDKVPKKNPFIAATLGIVSALALTMTGLFIWKAVTATPGGGDTPEPIPDPGDSSKPLTFVCLQEGGSVRLSYYSYNDISNNIKLPEREINLEYQIDDGEWTKVNGLHQSLDQEEEEYDIEIANDLNMGQEVHLRGDNPYWSYIPYDSSKGVDDDVEEVLSFTTEKLFSVENNVMSLLHKEDFKDATDVGQGCFTYLLSPVYTDYMNSDIFDASRLILPEIDLPAYCYASMFSRDKELVSAPQRIMSEDGSIGYNSCYQMFSNCTSLVTAPKQVGSAKGSVGICGCQQMFHECVKLCVAPELPSIDLSENSYYGMFYWCYSLRELKVGFGANGWPGNPINITRGWLSLAGQNYQDPSVFYWKGEATLSQRDNDTVPSENNWQIVHY